MDVIKINNCSACYRYSDDEMASISLITALINACLRHVHDRGCDVINHDDYTRIKDNATFLVQSAQVQNANDIRLDSILECFNDTDIWRKYI